MDQNLFRKKSMDRITSPEQLNDYLRVTSPSVWVILIAVVVMLTGLLIWSKTATIESYAEGSAEVKSGVMTIRFQDQTFAKNIKEGMIVSAGENKTEVASVGRDDHGLVIATAITTLGDGFYSVRVSYKQTQVLSLLFD